MLLNPKQFSDQFSQSDSVGTLRKTIEFFESKGKQRLKQDDRAHQWYADFLEFAAKEKTFATMLTPAGYGSADSRWDTWRISQFAEILGFYGLAYWYTWQVSVLGLGPIWMSDNETIKQEAASALQAGGIFAFGLSERAHGADVYSTDMQLSENGSGQFLANGEKYYIGNGNEAAIVSVFGKYQASNDYVFFAATPKNPHFECIRNVVNSQSYVSQFRLNNYPITNRDILSTGRDAWNAALNTVNIGKYNLGWASIGICTHAYYEAIHHAANRVLYGMRVTDFPHVRQLFRDAYLRLIAMKSVARRAADYMRLRITR